MQTRLLRSWRATRVVSSDEHETSNVVRWSELMDVFSKMKAALSWWAEPPASAAAISGARSASWRSVITEIGVTTPNCPYCGHAFEKMTQRKRACPNCTGVFYSRKRASDNAKVLLTEAQARVGEGQQALLTLVQENGTRDAELDSLVGALAAQLSRLPTADEVVTEYLKILAAGHAESWRWGLYRNARFNLAESCVRQGLFEEALRLFLEVSLLDLNGPRNMGSKDPAIVRRYPPFDPSTALLAPGVISRTRDLVANLNFSNDDTQRVFESVASSVGPHLKLPRTTASAWRELCATLVEEQR